MKNRSYGKWFYVKLSDASITEVKNALKIVSENLSVIDALIYEKGKNLKFKTLNKDYGYYLITLIVRNNPKMFVRINNN